MYSNIPLKPFASSPEEQERWNHTALRKRMILGSWEEDLENELGYSTEEIESKQVNYFVTIRSNIKIELQEDSREVELLKQKINKIELQEMKIYTRHPAYTLHKNEFVKGRGTNITYTIRYKIKEHEMYSEVKWIALADKKIHKDEIVREIKDLTNKKNQCLVYAQDKEHYLHIPAYLVLRDIKISKIDAEV